MGDVLAFIEHREGTFRGVSREVLSAAATVAHGLGGQVHALAIGGLGLGAATSTVQGFGASRIRVAEHEALSESGPERAAAVVAAAIREGGYHAVLFAATGDGRDLAPRVAALLDVPLATDATDLSVENGSLQITRPLYSGKVFARVRIDARPAVVSLRPNVFPVVERDGEAPVEVYSPEALVPERCRVVEFRAAEGSALDVSEASIVVSGGRGMKGPEHWHLLEGLRDAIGDGAALGASRAVVDAGWRPHGEQVGQTGKTVAPKLYFAIGISGAIQHLAGMRTAQTIVAINKDPDAPIFRVADYGIVGDVAEVLPRLTEAIRALKSAG